MQRKSTPIAALLQRTFLPAVVIVAILLAFFVYDRLYDTILDGFERKLVTTSALTGAMIDPADHDALIEDALNGRDSDIVEASERYRRNTDPIRRIRAELGLTYLYSQIVGGPSDILYILDGSDGDDHSPIGYADDLPDATVAGLERVNKQGAIYVSPIEYQEQWGLLKTAAAPILGRDGNISGSAGADVDISVIQVATQNALFASAMIGIGSILACLLVTLVLVRRIAKPIAALTEDTLRIAAGDRPRSDAVHGPREIRDLRAGLGALVEKMSSAAARRDAAAAKQDSAAVADMLAAKAGGDPAEPVVLVEQPGLKVIWMASEADRGRSVLAHCAMEQLARRIAADPALAPRWRDLAELDQGGCIAANSAAGTIESVGSAVPALANGGERIALDAGVPRAFDLSRKVTLVRPGRSDAVIWAGGGA